MHNFVALTLWATASALFVLALALFIEQHAVYRDGLPAEKVAARLRMLTIPCAFAGVLLALPGGLLALTWPLSPGAANIYIGSPAFFFGLLLLAASVLLGRGERLAGLVLVAPFGGLMTVVIGVALILFHIGKPLPFEFGGQGVVASITAFLLPTLYLLTGLAALGSPLLFVGPLARSRTLPLIAAGVLWLACAGFLLQAIIAQISHIGLFLK